MRRRLARLLTLGLILGATPSPAGAASSTHAAALLADEQIEAAASEIAALKAEQGDKPEVLFLEGSLRFYQGRYADAVVEIDRALASTKAVKAEWQALRDLAAATRDAGKDFVEKRSPEGHFILRHAPGSDALLVSYAATTLEAARREIAGRDFGLTDHPSGFALLGEPVRVEIYPRIEDLAQVSPLSREEIETSGTVAICKFNRLMVVSPRALVRGYPWLDTLAHEYTHYVLMRLYGARVPVWLHEGLAKFEERRWREPQTDRLPPLLEHLLATALTRGRRLIRLDEMHPSLAKLPSQAEAALAFAEVYGMVAFLHGRWGWSGIRRLLDQLHRGEDEPRAIGELTGSSLEDLFARWKTWLRERKLRAYPGLVPPALEFASAARDEKTNAHDDFDASLQIKEGQARRFARLGELLRRQAHPAAAAVEFERAQAVLVPGGSPPVAGRLARIYLELGQPERAIAAATPAYELAPEAAGLAVALGEAWLRQREPARALPYLEAAIAVNPFDPTPHCRLAQVASGERADRERAACRELSREP